jgi:hypothetical protein
VSGSLEQNLLFEARDRRREGIQLGFARGTTNDMILGASNKQRRLMHDRTLPRREQLPVLFNIPVVVEGIAESIAGKNRGHVVKVSLRSTS